MVAQLEGAYGIVVKSSHWPNELVAACYGSPLAISSVTTGSWDRVLRPALMSFDADADGSSEFYVASDPAALVGVGGRVMHLEDCDIVHIADGQARTFSAPPRTHSDSNAGGVSPSIGGGGGSGEDDCSPRVHAGGHPTSLRYYPVRKNASMQVADREVRSAWAGG